MKPEVAAGRLAEGERVDALLREPLLTDILSSSSGEALHTVSERVQHLHRFFSKHIRLNGLLNPDKKGQLSVHTSKQD